MAGRAVLLIPHRSETGDEAALPGNYRKILAIVRDFDGPVQVRAVGERLGLDTSVRGKLEPLRAKMTKLADRKIIQVRLDLPVFRERDAAAMSIRALNALLDSHGLSMKPGEQQRFSEAYFRHLQDRLKTPRAIKRYFGQADATLGSLVHNVDLVDFLLVTFLRTSEPGVYRMLARHRAELTGTSFHPTA
ncbi:hypothetical protein [Streptomyces ochraceiscleroticus]|uniref:GntR C-terminal domain-containing protein n=1 Tax=Streptomyces ochraceiscleroticus TaxID=47761 RepID=A0ABW1MJB1_9ACTN|nr:hypothetical protein [Streptomyces ochraceiscleroticus]